ncbi:cell division protein ZapB [Spirosoma utsteinense]|uniref:Archaellum component FlaC n=1 Tax=Spirosoma utsteinense TaxID=2585773 RepID=A0ABR6W0F5_9BACT|nr:cell division protein ZapB [Spirosoma utsteinense]MBC3783762.1 archaellum component FlaC [Spirosoma utsteinense]MBC3790094.1 archaellum component FlaC [Spirosoma utsteinense]
MYLEERIEQVEKQNETTARAVAELTIDVRAIRRDQNEGFKQVNARLDRLETDVSGLKQDVSDLKQDVSTLKQDVSDLKQDMSTLKQDVSDLKQDMSTIKQTLQFVLAYLQEKLP